MSAIEFNVSSDEELTTRTAHPVSARDRIFLHNDSDAALSNPAAGSKRRRTSGSVDSSL